MLFDKSRKRTLIWSKQQKVRGLELFTLIPKVKHLENIVMSFVKKKFEIYIIKVEVRSKWKFFHEWKN